MRARLLILLGPLIAMLAAAQAPATPKVQPRFDASAPAAPTKHTRGQLDSNETLFTVLAAINAGGYDAEIANEANSPLRKAVRDHLKALDLPIVDELRRFVRGHLKTDAGADLSQYISYALVVNGPPDFAPRYNSSTVPPDVDALYGLTPLIVQFYRDAQSTTVETRPAGPTMRPFTAPAPGDQRGGSGELLSSPGHRRLSGPQFSDLRRPAGRAQSGADAQLCGRLFRDPHALARASRGPDPPRLSALSAGLLPLKYTETVSSKHALGDYALGSSVLEQQYKDDFMLLTTECLIKAIESRLDRKPAEVDQALSEGFVMTPALAELLPDFEKQEQSMRLYFPAMIDAIDLAHEEKRLDHIQFATSRSNLKIRQVTREVAPAPLTGVEKTLDDAEKAYLARDLPRAREIFMRSLKETDLKSAHAKAYYGLARISLLEKDPAKADELFQVVLDQDPDAATKSWSLLYLGRLADSQGAVAPEEEGKRRWREEAVEHYKAALAVPGLPDSVREAAEQGLKSAFTKK